MDSYERIYEVVRRIPRGTVACHHPGEQGFFLLRRQGRRQAGRPGDIVGSAGAVEQDVQPTEKR